MTFWKIEVCIKWWTLGSANLLEANQLQSVIEAAYSLIRLGEVKSAESLLKPFASELAEVGPSINQGLAMTCPSIGLTNGRSTL